MDRKQLVTIAITAVTSVMAKEFVSWVVAWTKSNAQTETARAKAKFIFSRSNLKSAALAGWFLLTGFLLWSNLHETSPVTRVAVMWTVMSLLNVFSAFMWVSLNISVRILDLQRSRTVHPSPSVDSATVSDDTPPPEQNSIIPNAPPE